ncbi:hypothetical protein CE91St44_00210 [Oscillospiraceae bacterium]|uniref:DUF2975 domain-containing protein n=1 Tax=Allofournierella sp. TaxID=1940256 RepID=UPI0015AD1717|nr:hypothetical protein CE91St44_00210 [Oscillospiraceae bacterium]
MWSEKNSIALSQIAVKVFLGILVGCDVGGWWLVDWFLGWTRYWPMDDLAHRVLFLASLYAASVPAYCILLCLTRLLANISDGQVFIPQNVRALRSASWCCVAAALVCLASCFYYIPFLAVAVAAAFMALIIRIIKNVFEQAIGMKSELDLTV